MGGAYSTRGTYENACKVLVRKIDGKRPPGRANHRWEGNIKLDV